MSIFELIAIWEYWLRWMHMIDLSPKNDIDKIKNEKVGVKYMPHLLTFFILPY